MEGSAQRQKTSERDIEDKQINIKKYLKEENNLDKLVKDISVKEELENS